MPGQLLGRVVIFMRVITWSTASLGALLGGLVIECTHNMILVYAALGLHIIGIAPAFFATPLGRTDSTEAQPEQHKTSE